MYFDAIAKVISDRTGCDISAVKPESTFVELGIDSLDTVELLMNLEDEPFRSGGIRSAFQGQLSDQLQLG